MLLDDLATSSRGVWQGDDGGGSGKQQIRPLLGG